MKLQIESLRLASLLGEIRTIPKKPVTIAIFPVSVCVCHVFTINSRGKRDENCRLGLLLASCRHTKWKSYCQSQRSGLSRLDRDLDWGISFKKKRKLRQISKEDDTIFSEPKREGVCVCVTVCVSVLCTHVCLFTRLQTSSLFIETNYVPSRSSSSSSCLICPPSWPIVSYFYSLFLFFSSVFLFLYEMLAPILK